MSIVVKIFLSIVSIVSLALLVVFTLALLGPGIHVVSGPQVRKNDIETMQRLGMLENGEQLLMFYSDALYSIEAGFYILTDRKIGIYSEEYSEPAIRIPLEQIEGYEIDYDESFWDPSILTIHTKSQLTYTIPLSNEGGGDRRFVELLSKKAPKYEPADAEFDDAEDDEGVTVEGVSFSAPSNFQASLAPF